MVGQGVLRECLLDPSVQHVLSIVRGPTGQQAAKLTELVHKDFFDYSLFESHLAGYDACFFCAGPSSAESTEQGRTMWARIKGKTENALLRLPFKAAYMFRPGAIEPMHGARSKTALYRLLYISAKPLFPLLRFAFPGSILTTEQIGRAMLAVARTGAPKQILASKDIRARARS